MGDVKTASDATAVKIHSKLQAAVAAAAFADPIDVMVYAKQGADLGRYMDNLLVRKYVMPNGTQAYFGRTKAGQVMKIASLPDVAYVQEMKFPGDLPQPLEGQSTVLDPDALKARWAALKAGQKATVERPVADKAQIADWMDILDVHKSRAAWDLGYTGEGVKVMVNDSGLDFAHPDLQGTQARDTDPESPYYGWPIAFDSISMLALAYDYFMGTTFIADGVGPTGGAPDYADTSTTRSGDQVIPCGCAAETVSALFQPIGAAAPHVYTFKPTSQSGVYHFGSHVDTYLMKAGVFAERWAVLVVDEHVAGVYDTVYVDLDGDYNFTNEKPARMGSEEIYQDLDGDGYADISGGSIYWISDGANPLPGSDWLWGIEADVAGPGDLVAFTVMDSSESGGNHGQQCASAVAAQGIIDGNSPLTKPAGDGSPNTGMVNGGGKNVGLVASGNFYLSVDENEGYLFAALGYDGFPGTDDDAQIISNSWGDSGTHNDGWDYNSRSTDMILRWVNPTLSDMNSTGNGAPGYGTVTSPGAALTVGVGASTLYDSTDVFDRPVSKDQFNFNDSMSWSNRGPTAQGENGVSVLANGAWGAGDLAVNQILDGWKAWNTWGGTSRSAPVAAGNLALVYDAFKQATGRWPTNVEARAILMSGADDAGNDGLTQGAGTVNALRAVQIAAGLNGVYAVPDNWSFGDFRGAQYDAFASIMHPGSTATKEFTLYNQGATDVTVNISDQRLVKVGTKEWSFTTADRTAETKSTRLPDYLFDITKDIPAGTALMEVKLAQPFGEFDPEGDYAANSTWRLVPYDWADLNGDGKLWTDLNGNGAVNCPIVGGLPNFNDPACEIQREYNRFGYGYNTGTALQQRVKWPLARMHNGVFVGLQHRANSAQIPVTHLKFQVNFYKLADFPWLTTDSSVTVPAGGSATFNATMAVPALAGIGLYDGFIRLSDGANVSNIPVVANVAAWSTDFLFGGPPDSTSAYDNGQVYGYFDWSWRKESGDWRFYFVDVPDGTPAGTNLLVDNRWTGANTDIDTLIMGPTEDCFSNGVGCQFPFEIFPGDEEVYGPYSLSVVGGSPQLNMSAGVWQHDTSTGGPREIVAAPAQPGLNLVALHNVMFDGGQVQERFQGQVGTISATPDPVDIFVGNTTSGSFPMSVKSSLPLADLNADGFGMSVPEVHAGLPQIQDDPDDPKTSSYKFPITINHGARLDVSTAAAAGDMDLFLLYDYNADGVFSYPSEMIASSTTSGSNESVRVAMPQDGNYEAWVHGWSAALAATFDLTINAVQGNALTVGGLPTGPYQPNQPINFDVNWTLPVPLAAGEAAEGLLLAGPTGAPGALEIPVRLHNITTGTMDVTLFGAADATLQQWSPNTNMGNNPDLYVGFADSLRTVMKFDTSGINPMYPVLSAKMHVYVNGFGSTGQPHTLGAYPITKAWDVGTVTWLTPWTAAGGDFMTPAISSVPISNASVGTWLTLDVTSAAAQWVANPAQNNGVMLRATNGAAAAQFRLSGNNAWVAAQKPWLEVTYAVP